MRVGDAMARVTGINRAIEELKTAQENAQREEGKYGRMQFNSLNSEQICEIIGFLEEYKTILCQAPVDM